MQNSSFSKNAFSRHLMCEHNLGNAKTKATCLLKFKTEEEKQAHKNVAHLWRDRDNKAATKCSKVSSYLWILYRNLELLKNIGKTVQSIISYFSVFVTS